MKRIFLAIAAIAVTAVVSVAVTRAYFSDTETSTGNTFAAGTLDLKVDDEDTPITKHFSVSDLAPGYDSGYSVWCLKNTGTIPGQPYIEFSTVTNNENGIYEDTEGDAETEAYARTEGELGEYLKYTIGVGPCNWSVPSLLSSQWQTGPVHPWGIPGLDSLSGNTYFKGPTGYKFPVLNQGETYGFFMKTSLDDDLEIWDGTKWIGADDNIIQSDGVSFDITFHLDQVEP